MLIKWDLASKIQCSETEKEECVELLEKLLSFSQKSRKYGLLSLEDEINNSGESLLRKGIELIISGTEPDFVKEVLETYIAVGNYNGKELLKRVLILEGILGIQRGESDVLLRERLSAYFGESYINKFMDNFSLTDDNKIKEYFEKIKDGSLISSKACLLEKTFKCMDDRSIQRVLREIELTDIVYALVGTSADFHTSILRNCSKKSIQKIVDELIANPENSNKHIDEAQQKVLNIVLKLKENKVIC